MKPKNRHSSRRRQSIGASLWASLRSAFRRPRRANRVRGRRVGVNQRRSDARRGPPLSWPAIRHRLAQRVRAVAPYVAAAAVAAVVPLLAYQTWCFFTDGQHFAVKEVCVEGNDRVSAREVLSLTGLQLGGNAIGIDPETLQAELEEHPLLREADVELDLPGRVTIRVRERQAAALVALGELFYADEQGVIFESVRPGETTAGLAVITGLQRDQYEDEGHAARSESVVREALMLIAEYAAHPLATGAPLEELHYDATYGWTAMLGPHGPEVHLGWRPRSEQWDRLTAVMADLHARGERALKVNLDDERDPYRVVVQPGRSGHQARSGVSSEQDDG